MGGGGGGGGGGGELTPLAMRRLQRDIVEMEKEALPGMEVRIDPADISKMCLLLTPLEGPYMGTRLHLSVAIPRTYPHQPPRVSIQTPIHGHPNVFDKGYICCDILNQASSNLRSPQSYSGGYTPAYLLQYVFMQILSFFSSSWVEQETLGGDADEVVKRKVINSTLGRGLSPVSPYSCVKCGFDSRCRSHNSCSATVYDDKEQQVRQQSAEAPADEATPADDKLLLRTTMAEDLLDMLPDEVWLLIFDHLSDQDLVSLGRASPSHAGVVLCKYHVRVRRELICFFSRKTFQEAVLGVGVRVVDYRARRCPDLSLEAFDLLSLEAFEREHVRWGVRGHKFTHFLPLALDQAHFTRALPALHGFLASLQDNSNYREFLDVIPKLMNTMVVNMMKECEAAADATVVDHLHGRSHNNRSTTVSRHSNNFFEPLMHMWLQNDASAPSPSSSTAKPISILQASENAFRGYCLLFHLLLSLAETHPELTAEAQRRFHLFFHNEKQRNKMNIPNLGEFLAILPLVLEENFQWPALCSCIVEELLTRNVQWVLRAKPELANSGISARVRLRETFEASKTGLRLTMLQARFMRALVKVRSKLSGSYGFPPDAMAVQLVELVHRIYSVGIGRGKQGSYGAWRDFFTLMQYEPIPTESETERMLKLAIQKSENKRYHHPHQLRPNDYRNKLMRVVNEEGTRGNR